VVIDSAWEQLADEDYRTIFTIYSSDNTLHRSICFHAQQYVEKILKGMIKANGITPPKTHNINILLKQVSSFSDEINLSEVEAAFLSSVYIDFRYPTDQGLLPDGEPQESDREFAIQIVKKLHTWLYDK
jgi:HEPN domain-containing protein